MTASHAYHDSRFAAFPDTEVITAGFHDREFDECNVGGRWPLRPGRRKRQAGHRPGRAAQRLRAAVPAISSGGAACTGTIGRVDRFEHFGLAVHHLEIALGRTDEKEWGVPVFAIERVLGGYVPQAGDTVAGTMWLQGRVLRVGA
jgi:hypothetical protein